MLRYSKVFYNMHLCPNTQVCNIDHEMRVANPPQSPKLNNALFSSDSTCYIIALHFYPHLIISTGESPLT